VKILIAQKSFFNIYIGNVGTEINRSSLIKLDLGVSANHTPRPFGHQALRDEKSPTPGRA
jgi:hypothetical protein